MAVKKMKHRVVAAHSFSNVGDSDSFISEVASRNPNSIAGKYLALKAAKESNQIKSVKPVKTAPSAATKKKVARKGPSATKKKAAKEERPSFSLFRPLPDNYFDLVNPRFRQKEAKKG